QVRPDHCRRELVRLAQEFGDEFGVGNEQVRVRGGRATEVKFDAVAGAEDDRLAAVADVEFLESPCKPGLVEGEPLARGDVGGAEGGQDHGLPPGTTVCVAPRVNTRSTKATIVSRAMLRPRRWAPSRR